MVDPYQSHDPWNSFRETVQVGRNGIFYHDVTIYYFNQGRGEFRITDGGTKILEQPVGRDRRLTVQTRNGHTFGITRRRGGGYYLNTGGFWLRDLGQTYLR